MPSPGFITITVREKHVLRLASDVKEILKDSPVKIERLSPSDQLEILLDEHEKTRASQPPPQKV